MKLKKKVKKYINAIRPLVDVKFSKSQKEKKALKELLFRLKKKQKVVKQQLKDKNLSGTKRKDVELEIEIIKKQRSKGLKLLRRVKKG